MSHFSLTVNGKSEFDGVVDQWAQSPPGFIQEHLKPGSVPQQWMKSVMMVFTDCMMTGKSAFIDITHEPGSWSIVVKEKRR